MSDFYRLKTPPALSVPGTRYLVGTIPEALADSWLGVGSHCAELNLAFLKSPLPEIPSLVNLHSHV